MSETTQSGSQTGGQTGKPGRYQRSFSGLIGSMIVLVLVVFGVVIFRGTFRDTPEYEPEHIDYLELVASVQQAGLNPVYPPALPADWSVKDAAFDAGDRPSLDLVFTTADDRTAGIHQEDTSEEALITTYVGEGATRDADTEPLVTDVGTWQGWTDTDGDHAWTTEVDDQTVLVYSSGDPGDLTAFVESLTTDPLTP